MTIQRCGMTVQNRGTTIQNHQTTYRTAERLYRATELGNDFTGLQNALKEPLNKCIGLSSRLCSTVIPRFCTGIARLCTGIP